MKNEYDLAFQLFLMYLKLAPGFATRGLMFKQFQLIIRSTAYHVFRYAPVAAEDLKYIQWVFLAMLVRYEVYTLGQVFCTRL